MGKCDSANPQSPRLEPGKRCVATSGVSTGWNQVGIYFSPPCCFRQCISRAIGQLRQKSRGCVRRGCSFDPINHETWEGWLSSFWTYWNDYPEKTHASVENNCKLEHLTSKTVRQISRSKVAEVCEYNGLVFFSLYQFKLNKEIEASHFFPHPCTATNYRRNIFRIFQQKAKRMTKSEQARAREWDLQWISDRILLSIKQQ